MSRLQVGGLALIIGSEKLDHNIGKVVNLVEHHNCVDFDDGTTWLDCWIINDCELVDMDGNPIDWLVSKSIWLMPLGDKKTQDEFKKELECVE